MYDIIIVSRGEIPTQGIGRGKPKGDYVMRIQKSLIWGSNPPHSIVSAPHTPLNNAYQVGSVCPGALVLPN